MKSPLNYSWPVACMSTHPDLFGPYSYYLTFNMANQQFIKIVIMVAMIFLITPAKTFDST